MGTNEGSTPGLERACNSEKICDSIEFGPPEVSLRTALSTMVEGSIPTGKMIFTVLGAVAELERSLIAEGVRAGLPRRTPNQPFARLLSPPAILI
jgi:hypothetical protein